MDPVFVVAITTGGKHDVFEFPRSEIVPEVLEATRGRSGQVRINFKRVGTPFGTFLRFEAEEAESSRKVRLEAGIRAAEVATTSAPKTFSGTERGILAAIADLRELVEARVPPAPALSEGQVRAYTYRHAAAVVQSLQAYGNGLDPRLQAAFQQFSGLADAAERPPLCPLPCPARMADSVSCQKQAGH